MRGGSNVNMMSARQQMKWVLEMSLKEPDWDNNGKHKWNTFLGMSA